MRGFILSLCLLALYTSSIVALPRGVLNEVTGEPDPGDDIKCEDGVEFIPHQDCTKYYMCDNGVPVTQTCAGGLYFNPRTNLCDFDFNVPECVEGTRPPSNTPRPTDNPTQRPTDAPTERPTDAPTQRPTDAPTQRPTDSPTQRPTDAPTQRPTDLPTNEPTNRPTQQPTTPGDDVPCREGVEFIPHQDCTKYYMCANGVPVIQTCAGSLYFNPRTNLCDFDFNVPECVEGTRPPSNTPRPTGSPTQNPTDAPTQRPTDAPTDIPTQRPTDTPTQRPTDVPTDVPTERSTGAPTNLPSETPSIPTPNPICKDSETVYNVPYAGNCSLYYICAFGTPVLKSCAQSLLFDSVILDCVREEDAKCYEELTEAPAPTTPEPHVCRPGEIYYVEFPGNCSKYILCANGTPITQTCATGTIFNPEESKCVREEDYECPYSPLRRLYKKYNIAF